MNIVNISLTVNSVELFDVPGQQPFSVAECSYFQSDKDGNKVEHSILVKAYNYGIDKTTSGISADRLLMAKPQPNKPLTNILVCGKFWTESRDKDTKEIIDHPYILAHSIAPIKPEVEYNHIYLAGRLITPPKKVDLVSSGKSYSDICIRIASSKGKGHLYNVVAWNKNSDTIQRYCRKGEYLGVEGFLDFQSWEDKNTGEFRKGFKIQAIRVKLMGTLEPKEDEF